MAEIKIKMDEVNKGEVTEGGLSIEVTGSDIQIFTMLGYTFIDFLKRKPAMLRRYMFKMFYDRIKTYADLDEEPSKSMDEMMYVFLFSKEAELYKKALIDTDIVEEEEEEEEETDDE